MRRRDRNTAGGRHFHPAHAIADYSEALRLYPKNASALKGRGRAYEAQGDSKRVEADFKAANGH